MVLKMLLWNNSIWWKVFITEKIQKYLSDKGRQIYNAMAYTRRWIKYSE